MSGSPARTATAEDLFERRVPHLYHLADDSVAISSPGTAMAVRRLGAVTRVVARSDGPCGISPRVVKETHVSSCHVLGELAHVLVEHPGPLAPGVVS